MTSMNISEPFKNRGPSVQVIEEGEEFIKFLSALAVLPRTILKNGQTHPFLSNHPGAIHPILQNRPRRQGIE